ncbi:hypothetical protein HER10_EVM0010121 [Colletotrichum scovillei]|uniref:Uncharacterized protein n=1 Tax=Colletotrichum scovillei TaxID=1209932 RepID=A0A9P7UIS7_9PEZI|nr:uncharacterized protein HER10_EVM0010121 [Colletotrichum scovillei]KAF4785804.1 hypothetical protein HER10_EVM0010121 [Colletotrichum scovillei]KAG7054847.1 hypothetical protein JMJ77_0007321 [Colletotrichum scovillei]KAG7074324.1 hypothetical protein JMJ76_0010807 [Colletotrichum scovillei]KAG7081028.1 hypothetical protein JMJ78_0003160 [Colletotrichum scovillei]
MARHPPLTFGASSISLLAGYFLYTRGPRVANVPRTHLRRTYLRPPPTRVYTASPLFTGPFQHRIKSSDRGFSAAGSLLQCFTSAKMASRQSNVLGRLVNDQVQYSFIPHHPIKLGPGLHLSIQSSFPFHIDRKMHHVAFFGATGYTVFRCLMHALRDISIFCHVYVRCKASLLEMFDDADDFRTEYLDRMTVFTADLTPENAAKVLFPEVLRGEPVHTVVYGIGGFRT